MVGCNEPTKYEIKKENGMTYKVIVIDSCEYIWYKDNNTNGQTMAHKRTNKETVLMFANEYGMVSLRPYSTNLINNIKTLNYEYR